MPPTANSTRRVLVASLAGTAIEFFDFYIYAMASVLVFPCAEDEGCHTVCVEVTGEFLDFSRAAGNDLSTPRPEHNFPGLTPGDRWCLCALRWREAHQQGVAPPVSLASTHARTLDLVPLELLQQHATA